MFKPRKPQSFAANTVLGDESSHDGRCGRMISHPMFFFSLDRPPLFYMLSEPCRARTEED